MDFLAMMIVDVLLVLSNDAQMQKALDAKTPVTVATAVTASPPAGNASELVTKVQEAALPVSKE